jgi:hypothetical protein
MAIAFISGSNLNTTVNDPTQFNINLLQIAAPIGVKDSQTPLPLTQCGPLDWLGPTQQYYANLSCIYPNSFNWSGLLYASPITNYPRFSVNLCNISDPAAGCQSIDAIYKTTAGGRIFVFI